MPRDARVQGADPLVLSGDPHPGRLTDDDGGGYGQHLLSRRDHGRRAEAAHFLIVGEHQMHRPREAHVSPGRYSTQRCGNEPFHVTRAARVQAIVALGQGKGVAAPRLPVNRHDIRVPREDEPAFDRRSNRREEV